MLGPLVAALTLAPPDPHTLAYIARIYSQDPKVKTGYAVFVSDSEGHNAKRVTAAKESFDSVCWVGKSRIVWRTGPSSLGDMELWTSQAPFAKASLVTRAVGITFYRPELFTPSSGKPLFTFKSRKGVYAVDEKSGLLVTAEEPKFDFRELMTDPTLTDKPFLFKPPVEGQWSLNLVPKKAETGTEYDAEALSKNEKHPLDFAEHLTRLIWQEEKGKVWLVGATRDSTVGNWYSLWGFDWATGALKPVCQEAGEIDFFPGRRELAYTTVRELTPLGAGTTQVWTNQLWVGDVETGIVHRLFADGIHFASAAIRPASPVVPGEGDADKE